MPLVDVVGFRSDGTLLALAFEANEIVVWDGATGKELRRLQGHTGRVQCAAVSPDGRWLASAGWDQTVKVWDLADGRELHNLRGHRRSVDCLSFSRDGRLLASASRGAAPPVLRGEVKVWDLQAGKEKFGMGGQPSHFTGVAISPDGLELATASGDGIVRIWDIETRKESRSFSGNGQRVQVMAWNSAAHRVAFMVMDETGNEILRERGVMPRIAVARDDGIVRMLDTATGEEVFTLRGHIAPVQNLAFSRDGTRLASGGWDRTVRLWNATAGPEALALREEAKRSREHRPPPERYIGPRWLAFGSNGKELAAVCGVGTARLYDSRTGSVSATWNEEAHNLGDVAFSADGRLVAAALVPSEWDGPPGQRRDYPVKIWDRASGKEILTLHVQAHRVAFSPNGTLLATTHRGSIGVWDTQTGLQIFGVQTLTAGATCIAFTPDGRHLAGATSAPGFVRDGEPGATTHDLEIWDVTTRERVFHRSCQASVARLAFHPDGKRLACVGSGPGIVWNTSTGEHACTLSGHSDAMTDVLFSGDGRRVFTASDDRTVKVWDTDSGKELLTLRGHHQAVVGLALSPEDDSLASAGEDGIVRIWATASRP
jgi:WD40 repeat protein